MKSLTKKQKQILDLIKGVIAKTGLPPSFEEIKKHFKLSAVSTVHQHIEALVEKGFLSKEANVSRGIQLREQELTMVQIPLLGTVTAGYPIEAVEQKETIAVASPLLKRGTRYFALKVKGNSMIGEHIHDEDLILVRKQDTANNGDRVVALINNNEATLKKFYREKNGVRLQPANDSYNPIYIPKNQEIKIQGVVVAIIKAGKN